MKINKNSTLKRVKVYLLTDVWVDNGTGYCFAEILDNKEPCLIVKNELDESDELLRTKIEGSIQFQRQQETLIVWSDSNGQNIALSFQEKAGCASLCDFFIKINRNGLAPLISLVYIIPTEPDGSEVSEFITGPINYPKKDPTKEDLLDIFHKFNENPSSPYQRECIVKFIETNDYISKLTKLFRESEEGRRIKCLHILCNIIKTMILYNEVSVIELILEDRYMMDVVGILEYDPDFPLYKANHRSYLRDESKFKEVLPIKNEEIKKLIIKAFKLQFLKDVVLVRLLDDPTFNFISTLIHFDHIKIMGFLEQSNFIDELFEIYQHEGNEDKKQDGIRLIHQFILISKNLQPYQKTNFYKSLVKKGLLKTLNFVLGFDSVELRVLSTEILVSIIEHDVLLVSTCINDEEAADSKEEESEKDGNTVQKKGSKRLGSGPVLENELIPTNEEISLEKFNSDTYGDDECDQETFHDDEISDDEDDELNIQKTEKPLILSEDMTLLSMLTDFLLADNAPGLRIQSFEALKSLLDPMNNLNAPNSISEQILVERLDTESYFNSFYSKVAPKLFKPLIDESVKDCDTQTEADKINDDLFIHLCELINFCSKDRSISRSFFLENHILQGISKLISSNHKEKLRLASIRSLKAIIILNDDYYTRYIITNDLLKPVFQLFEETKEQGNLIYSTILDLLEIILLAIDRNNQLGKNNFKLLATYIVQSFKPSLEAIDTVHSGEDLIKFVETGELRKNHNSDSIDISVDFEDTSGVNESEMTITNGLTPNEDNEIKSDIQKLSSTTSNGDKNTETTMEGDDIVSHIHKLSRTKSNGSVRSMVDEVEDVSFDGKENTKDKRQRDDDTVSLNSKLANGGKKKATLKSKISTVSKKLASKFSSNK